MIDDRTTALNLPLPSLANYQDQDIPRLRAALIAIDTAMGALAHAVTSINGKSGPTVTLSKADIGLPNVDDVPAASLRSRATHTGTQAISTIAGLQDAIDAITAMGALRTAPFTVAAGAREPVDPQTCASVNGPADPAEGDTFELHDVLGKFADHPMTVYAGSVNGVVEGFVCDIAGAAFKFRREATTWRVSIVEHYS